MRDARERGADMSENEKPDVDDELGDDDLEAVVGGLTMKGYKVKGEA